MPDIERKRVPDDRSDELKESLSPTVLLKTGVSEDERTEREGE